MNDVPYYILIETSNAKINGVLKKNVTSKLCRKERFVPIRITKTKNKLGGLKFAE